MAFTPGSTHGHMANINMTPLIDVMLVLLIIFMVAAPMLTTGVDVSLPQSHTGKNLQTEALTVTLERDGRLQFEDEFVQEGVLKARLRQRAAESRQAPGAGAGRPEHSLRPGHRRGGRHPGRGVHPGGLRHPAPADPGLLRRP